MPLHPALQRKALHPGPGRVSGVQRREDVHAFQTPKGFLERSGAGDPLPAGVKQRMERYFSADFSDVRVHVGHEAKSIGALAFTLGSDIYFAPEHYRPGTRAGQELLGHELTHVVQQREGRVANPFGDGVAVVQDFELEAEADRHGKAAAEGRRGPGLGSRPSARPGANASGVQAKAAGYRLVVGAYMHEGRLPDEVAGHSFVAIEDPGGDRHAFGFSPAHYGRYDPKRDMGRLKAGVAGVVHDDAGAFDKPGVRTKAYPISAQQARAAMTKVSEYESGRHRYRADRQQCSTFALDVMRAARVEVPKAGSAPRPRAMYEALGVDVEQATRKAQSVGQLRARAEQGKGIPPHPGACVVQASKGLSKKQARERFKKERKFRNQALDQAKSKGLDTATNTAIAIGIRKYNASSRYTARSGAIDRAGVDYDEETQVFPWTGLNPVLNYPFVNCAEAKVWLRIAADHHDPKNYKITSYNIEGKVNPPCANCSLWVYSTFGEVCKK